MKQRDLAHLEDTLADTWKVAEGWGGGINAVWNTEEETIFVLVVLFPVLKVACWCSDSDDPRTVKVSL